MTFELRREAFVEAARRELDSCPVVLLAGPRGCGKSILLERILEESRRRRERAALLRLEPISCSPEVLDSEIHRLAGPIFPDSTGRPRSFDGVLQALRERDPDSLLLLDEVAEIRTLSYYPGVESPLASFLDAVASRGRAILTSRFTYWMQTRFPALRTLRIPRVSPAELAEVSAPEPELVAAASAGIAVHALRLAETLDRDRVSLEEALARELSPGGRIEAECRATFAELLHRARGYGACKNVLRVLSDEEGLKLVDVARRVDRTPGSTRDYLRWLEEVDLVVRRGKRYSYVDPLLRLWTRIHGRGSPARPRDLEAEVRSYIQALAPAPLEDEAAPAFILPEIVHEDWID